MIFRSSPPAGIRYIGIHGDSQECLSAVEQLLQFRQFIPMGWLLTHKNDHAFLLLCGDGELLAIKQGFTSGYSGQGPKALARSLRILQILGTTIEEVEVHKHILSRLESSSLTEEDVRGIRLSETKN